MSVILIPWGGGGGAYYGYFFFTGFHHHGRKLERPNLVGFFVTYGHSKTLHFDQIFGRHKKKNTGEKGFTRGGRGFSHVRGEFSFEQFFDSVLLVSCGEFSIEGLSFNVSLYKNKVEALLTEIHSKVTFAYEKWFPETL